MIKPAGGSESPIRSGWRHYMHGNAEGLLFQWRGQGHCQGQMSSSYRKVNHVNGAFTRKIKTEKSVCESLVWPLTFIIDREKMFHTTTKNNCANCCFADIWTTFWPWRWYPTIAETLPYNLGLVMPLPTNSGYSFFHLKVENKKLLRFCMFSTLPTNEWRGSNFGVIGKPTPTFPTAVSEWINVLSVNTE